jgi:hypothetical protein
MTQNLGRIERSIRIALGAVLLLMTVVGPASLVGLLGGALLVTGVLGYCPLYAILGVDTRRA